MTARFRTFSQAPQAVRSARGRRRDRTFPAGAATNRAFGADKRDPVDLTVQVHGLRHISTAAAVWLLCHLKLIGQKLVRIIADVSRRFV